MGMFTWLVVGGGLIVAVYAIFLMGEAPVPEIPEDGYWGPGEKPPADISDKVRPFKVDFPDSTIKDLYRRLDDVRVGHEELENTQFQYGFRTSVMKEVVKYWRNRYNWKEQQKKLNSLPQFVTNIEGIDVHFLHVKPRDPQASKAATPLMIVHGWPGSVWEMYKMTPLLTDPDLHDGRARDVFEDIVPSIPGYGFSEASRKQGFNAAVTARVFVKLMKRLGHDKFYVQGGDWGAAISTVMAQVYPEHVLGAHLNMYFGPLRTLKSGLTQIGLMVCPNLLLDREEQPYASKLNGFGAMIQETGYMHIQATKPDTVAFALNDSPVGLAAYILEKFSTWTNLDYRDLEDGGLTSKFTMDELLTNVMIYWLNGNIGSSMRFYKEFFGSSLHMVDLDGVPVNVPVGLAAFPDDFFFVPRVAAAQRYKNIVQYTVMPRGGHFAAMEEPELLASDISSFVRKVEEQRTGRSTKY